MIFGAAILDVAHGLREAFFMFWETLWPIILGFGLAGIVQAFVSPTAMERSLGNHRPATVAKASAFGMVSSSCSYAASAMAKSLFQRGADFLSAMAFMFASTNLVIELGIAIAILIGWQFTAAEFVGGPIMIALLVVGGAFVLSPSRITTARQRVNAGPFSPAAASGADADVARERVSWRKKVASLSSWADAASYTVADLKMLRRELAVGYLVAGLLAVLVPSAVWNAIFFHGNGTWTILENAVVGPVIAFASFVCSIGNVPLAAALWKGGISFGGVVSFIFADLVAAPLVLIYRRYYGTRLTLALVGLFWAVMSIAGLIVGGIFSAAGLVPTHRPKVIAQPSFHWNYTTILDFIFLALFAVLYSLYRNRDRFGGGGYALDPVCGMQVQIASAPVTKLHDGTRYFFCSDHCAQRFEKDSDRFAAARRTRASRPSTIDPVCGMEVDDSADAPRRVRGGLQFSFCSGPCAAAFDADPERYAAETIAGNETGGG